MILLKTCPSCLRYAALPVWSHHIRVALFLQVHFKNTLPQQACQGLWYTLTLSILTLPICQSVTQQKGS